jgi:hypothetical protein
MSRVKSLGCVVGVAACLLAGSASAQNFNRTTYLSFSTPVELPGVTLPAGTYMFRLSDSTSDRHVVQVLDKDGAKLHARILAMPAKRLHVDDKSVVTFHELPAEATPAVRYWYYPGDDIGQEFAYPKDQAMRIAAATSEPVLAVDDNSMARVEPDEAVKAQDAPPRPPPAQPATRERADTAPSEAPLPRTASGLPLAGLIGLLALGGAAVLRAVRAAV